MPWLSERVLGELVDFARGTQRADEKFSRYVEDSRTLRSMALAAAAKCKNWAGEIEKFVECVEKELAEDIYKRLESPEFWKVLSAELNEPPEELAYTIGSFLLSKDIYVSPVDLAERVREILGIRGF